MAHRELHWADCHRPVPLMDDLQVLLPHSFAEEARRRRGGRVYPGSCTPLFLAQTPYRSHQPLPRRRLPVVAQHRQLVHAHLCGAVRNCRVHRSAPDLGVCQQSVRSSCSSFHPRANCPTATNLEGQKFDEYYFTNRAGVLAVSQFPLITALGTKNNVVACTSPSLLEGELR